MSYDPETADLFDQMWDTRRARVDAQLEKIANTAHWLGCQLAKHKITRADANRRIRNLCEPSDVDDPTWVPWDLAKATAVTALHKGMGKTP